MQSLSDLSRERLLAIAEAKRRGLNLSNLMLPGLAGSGSASGQPGTGTGLALEGLVLGRSKLDPAFLERLAPAQRREILRCSRDFIYFCNNYAYVTEPRIKTAAPGQSNPNGQPGTDYEEESYQKFVTDLKAELERIGQVPDSVLSMMVREANQQKASGYETPFKLWDYQEEAYYWLDWLLNNGKSGLIEKCRDMGMTWLLIWYIVWQWLFRDNFSALLGSAKEALVDDFTLSSLFGKLDYAIEHLPLWMKPDGYDRKKHRTRLAIKHPFDSQSYILGDSQTADFGRSRRFTFVFIDEYAFWNFDVWGSVLSVSNTLIVGSSVAGENHFYRLRQLLVKSSPRLVLRMEWYRNVLHTQEWFARMQNQMDEATFGREILIDYAASVSGKYYPLCGTVPVLEDIPWRQGWPSVVSMDYGVRDDTAFIWWQRDPRPVELLRERGIKRYKMLFCYSNTDKPIGWYAPILLARLPDEEELAKYKYAEDDIDFIKMLIRAGVSGQMEFRGDPAGRARSSTTAFSIEHDLDEKGIYVTSDTKQNGYRPRKAALTSVMLEMEVSKAGAWAAWNAIRQAKYPERRINSQATTLTEGPVHDWTSHYRSAAEYFAVGEDSQGLLMEVISGQPDEQALALARAKEGIGLAVLAAQAGRSNEAELADLFSRNPGLAEVKFINDAADQPEPPAIVPALTLTVQRPPAASPGASVPARNKKPDPARPIAMNIFDDEGIEDDYDPFNDPQIDPALLLASTEPEPEPEPE